MSTAAEVLRHRTFAIISRPDADKLRARFGQAFDDVMESMELAVDASAEWGHEAFRPEAGGNTCG